MTHRLIITADDYGLCASVNQAIEECLAAGTLRATCVMTNMPACGSAPGLRTRFPEASIGLHWTLTQGRPVLDPQRIPTIVGTDGSFLTFGTLRSRLIRGRIDPSHVRAELLAQHQRFRELVGAADFWNSHQNIHISPGLFRMFVEVGRTCGIPAMRSQRRITAPRTETPLRYNLRHPLYWAKGQVIAIWTSQAARRGMLMPDGAIHAPGYTDGKAAIEDVVRQMRWSQVPGVAEYIIHPATTIEHDLFGALTDSRLREYEIFRDPQLKDRLRAMGVQPVGFEALALSTP